MTQQHCRVVINKLEALLAERTTDDSITPSLIHKYEDLQAAVAICCSAGPWSYNMVKHLAQDKVSTSTILLQVADCTACAQIVLQWMLLTRVLYDHSQC